MDRNTYILYGARANSFAIRKRKIDLKKNFGREFSVTT